MNTEICQSNLYSPTPSAINCEDNDCGDLTSHQLNSISSARLCLSLNIERVSYSYIQHRSLQGASFLVQRRRIATPTREVQSKPTKFLKRKIVESGSFSDSSYENFIQPRLKSQSQFCKCQSISQDGSYLEAEPNKEKRRHRSELIKFI